MKTISRAKVIEIMSEKKAKGFFQPGNEKYLSSDITDKAILNIEELYKAIKRAAKSGHCNLVVKIPSAFILNFKKSLENEGYSFIELPKYLDPLAESDFTKATINW